MNRPLCAVRDSAVGAFQAPFAAPSLGAAIRMFGDAVLNPEAGMIKHKEDFELYHIGEFDEESGIVVRAESVVCIARGKDYNGV